MADLKIPTEEPGLVQKTRMPYAEVMKLAGGQADLLHIPDVNHYDPRPFALFTKDDTLKALAESGCTHVFLELLPKFQEHVDALAGGQINADQFVERLQKNNFLDPRLDSPEALKSLADFITRSCQLGMNVHFSNPMNGTPLMVVAEISQHLQGKSGEELKKHAEILAAGISRSASPLREQVTAGILKKTPAEAADFWARLENADDALINKSKAEFEKAIADLATPQALKETRIAANSVRFDDKELASTISKTLNGEKGALFYGAQHGVGSNDLNEQLKLKDVDSCRLDVYPDRRSFQLVMDSLKKENALTGYQYGIDKPDLVYIVSEGVLYTTTETSPELIKAIQEKAKLEPVDSGDTYRGFDAEAAQKIIDGWDTPKTAPPVSAPQP